MFINSMLNICLSPPLPLQALGTAINSTKVMKAQQVVKGEDGGEVSGVEKRQKDKQE